MQIHPYNPLDGLIAFMALVLLPTTFIAVASVFIYSIAKAKDKVRGTWK